MSAASVSAVRATKARETADLEVERSASSTSAPTGSPVRRKRRVETPASIRSSTTSVSASRAAKCPKVESETSCASSALLTRGRLTATRRAPRVTEALS